jgi:hypothetical protein
MWKTTACSFMMKGSHNLCQNIHILSTGIIPTERFHWCISIYGHVLSHHRYGLLTQANISLSQRIYKFTYEQIHPKAIALHLTHIKIFYFTAINKIKRSAATTSMHSNVTHACFPTIIFYTHNSGKASNFKLKHRKFHTKTSTAQKIRS